MKLFPRGDLSFEDERIFIQDKSDFLWRVPGWFVLCGVVTLVLCYFDLPSWWLILLAVVVGLSQFSLLALGWRARRKNIDVVVYSLGSFEVFAIGALDHRHSLWALPAWLISGTVLCACLAAFHKHVLAFCHLRPSDVPRRPNNSLQPTAGAVERSP